MTALLINLYYYYRGLSINSASLPFVIAAVVVMVIGMIAQAGVNSTFRKYSQVRASSGVTAAEAASELLRRNGSQVAVTRIAGSLTDNYNPREGRVALSETVYGSNSVAALAVAAHECGHVMQYESGYFAIKLRNFLLPAAKFGSQFSYLLVVAGLFLGSFGYYVSLAGVVLFGFVFVFQLITLPVELNASSRALDMLTSAGFISGREEESAARKVLNAAAFTYVVSALASAVNFLRLFTVVSRRRQ